MQNFTSELLATDSFLLSTCLVYSVIGSMNDDYRTIFKLHHNDDNSYSATGAAPSIVSNRVSHVYDLHGPSITVDTACSSSLTAVHLARQAIQAGKDSWMFLLLTEFLVYIYTKVQ